MVSTGNGELGFYFEKGAWKMATTFKEGSRRTDYQILKSVGGDNKYQYRWLIPFVIEMSTI